MQDYRVHLCEDVNYRLLAAKFLPRAGGMKGERASVRAPSAAELCCLSDEDGQTRGCLTPEDGMLTPFPDGRPRPYLARVGPREYARLTDLPPPPPLLWPGDDGYDDDEVPEIPKQVAPCTLGLVEAGTGAVSLLGYTGYVRVC